MTLLAFTFPRSVFAQTPALPEQLANAKPVIEKRVATEIADLVALYKHLHSHAELSLQEEQTSLHLAKELRAAGFDRLELRPFFSPQRFALPRFAESALQALERTPLATLLLRFRFSYVCAASRCR